MRERASREQQKEKEINEIAFVASSWSRRDSRQQTDGCVGGFVLSTVLGNRYLYLYNTQVLIFFCSFSERERKSRREQSNGFPINGYTTTKAQHSIEFSRFSFFFSFLNAKKNRIAYTHTRTLSREWRDFLLPFRSSFYIRPFENNKIRARGAPAPAPAPTSLLQMKSVPSCVSRTGASKENFFTFFSFIFSFSNRIAHGRPARGGSGNVVVLENEDTTPLTPNLPLQWSVMHECNLCSHINDDMHLKLSSHCPQPSACE